MSAIPRDCWYFTARSDEVRRDHLFARRVAGHHLVLGRDGSGAAFALHDACPHRGMPLRHGRCVDGTVECCYHGWRFRPDGTCAHVPALTEHDDARLDRIRVPRFPVHEANGLVWIFVASEQSAVPEGTPFPYDFGVEGPPLAIVRSPLPCDLDTANFGLLDPAHVPFVHRSWYWRPRGERRVKTKHFEACPLGFQMVAHAPSKNSLAMRVLGREVTTQIRFQLPGVRTESIATERGTLLSITLHTPIDDETTEFNHVAFLPPNPLFRMMKPLFVRFGRSFVQLDLDNFAMLSEGRAYAPHGMTLGEVDAQYRWYVDLKRRYAASDDKAAVEGEPDREVLHWRT